MGDRTGSREGTALDTEMDIKATGEVVFSKVALIFGRNVQKVWSCHGRFVLRTMLAPLRNVHRGVS